MILPIKTVSEMNGRDHWTVRSRRAKAARRCAFHMVSKHPLPCIVTLTRLSPGTLDDDNLRSALKATRDGIAEKLGADDRPGSGIEWRYGQEICRRGDYGVRVEIESAGERIDEA
jgi:hypothetical protein